MEPVQSQTLRAVVCNVDVRVTRHIEESCFLVHLPIPGMVIMHSAPDFIILSLPDAVFPVVTAFTH